MPISVKVAHQFSAPAEEAFNAWLDPDKVRAWMSRALKAMDLSGEIGRVEIDPRLGGSFLFSDIRDGTEFKHWGTYLEMEFPRRLAFTWNTADSDETDPCNVYLTFEPDGDGSLVTIVNDIEEKWADYVDLTENGWKCILQAEDDLLKR